MDLTQALDDLVAVALVAALTPLVVAILPGPRIPQVVVFLLGGVLIGPHVLGLAETSSLQLLSNIGLGFLFLLAGYELDPMLLRQRPGELAMLGWLISAVIAVAVAGGLTAAGYIRDYVPVGLALTTTALGTLLPILHDNDMLGGRFGRDVFAAGAVGELFPILIIAIFLTQRARLGRAGLGGPGRGARRRLVRRALAGQEPDGTAGHPGGPGCDRADHAALGRGAAVRAARLRQPVRPRCGARRRAGRDRAARLDPPVQHGHRRPGA